MAITSRVTLVTAIGAELNRSDVATVALDWIDMAESGFRRDERVRALTSANFTVDAEEENFPTAFMALEAFYHNGTEVYGELEVVNAGSLALVKRRHGALSGPPSHVALLDGKFRFAPVPDKAYAMKIAYWASITQLAADADTNWLLTDHPDIYFYGALVHSAPWAKDDSRLPVWRDLLEERLEQMHMATTNKQFSGQMRRQHRTFGG
jgi:hypothetical protein